MCCPRSLSGLLKEFREMPVVKRRVICKGCIRLEANWVMNPTLKLR